MVQKSPDAFRTISEVAEIIDTPAHVLRFWEGRFSQIKPVKRGGGRRYYRPQDIDLLRGIRDLLYRDGLTIKGVQKVLRERGVKHVVGLGHLAPEADPMQGGTPPPAPSRKDPPLTAPPRAVPETLAQTTAETPAPQPPADPVAARDFPAIDLPQSLPETAEEDAQFDLFADAGRRTRRPFPPDPARAERTAALRSLLTQFVALRERMAARGA
ncbi:MAG: MerR family transcriptional regulator [Pseudomonadota bacterium]